LSAPRPPETAPPPTVAAEAPPTGSWRRRTFASFGVPGYRWFFFGQGTSFVGSWVRATAQGWLVYTLTGSRLDLGTVAALGQLPLFLAPVAGSIADRVDKRRLLVVLAAFAMAISLVLAWLTWTGQVRVGHVMVLAALAGVEFAFELPTRQSWVVEVVGREHLMNAIALNSAMFNSARMAGPALAGLLMGTFAGEGRDGAMRGIAFCFLVDGLSFLAVIFALLRIRPVHAAARAAPGGLAESLREGFAYVRGNRRARILLTLMAISIVFGWSYLALMPALAKDVLGLDETGFGLLLAANGVGAALGALWVAGRPEAKTRRVLRRRVFGSIALFGSMVVALSFQRDPRLAAVAVALSGFGAISFVSTGNTLIQQAVPDALRGRVMGIWGLVFGGSFPTGSWLLGLLAERTDVPFAIGLGGALCLALSAVVWLRLPPAADSDAAPASS
jgi:MFS family permease